MESGSKLEKDKELVVDYFVQMFSDRNTKNEKDSLPGGYFPIITRENYQQVTKSFTSEEVYEALKAMAPFKTPSPDSFPTYAFQKYWNLIVLGLMAQNQLRRSTTGFEEFEL